MFRMVTKTIDSDDVSLRQPGCLNPRPVALRPDLAIGLPFSGTSRTGARE